MGSGTLCLGCNLHEDSPAPAVLARRGRACRLSLRRGRACGFNPPAFKRAYRIRGVRRILMGGDMLCLGCILRKDSPAPEARHGCRLSLPRLPHPRGARFLWEVMRSIMSKRSYGQ